MNLLYNTKVQVTTIVCHNLQIKAKKEKVQDCTFESVTSSCFSPIHASSPCSRGSTASRYRSKLSSSEPHPSVSYTANGRCPTKKANLRVLTLNCCGIRSKKAEFAAALEYTKPDVICGSESWLRGIQPGKDPDRNAIQTAEVFPNFLTDLAGVASLELVECFGQYDPAIASRFLALHQSLYKL
ncbi:hypothetical protein MAR_022030 [Mya arenaria]|uniref:Endonuclease/exonuclease/phosphatase domain-containing protein n=1 Tax=Mya arenaria TaxID=6604 RepID=A0ABY7ED65_MYAAR|nr:hypothetical protein MAR_022030 [Mya arenaria]